MLVHDSVIDPLAQNFARLSFSLPTVHGVTFQQDGITTYKGWQYATYYQGNTSDSSGKVGVARRPLPSGAWETLVLHDYIFTTVDSHNDAVIGICPGDGRIHLSFDHHGDPLNYRVTIPGAANNPTTTAWTPSLFGPVIDHLFRRSDHDVRHLSEFHSDAGGQTPLPPSPRKLQRGRRYIYEYDGATHEWSLVGKCISHTGTYAGRSAPATP